MTSQQRSAAGAAGGKTARACDSCLRRRARWYCAADDAFLCQACDSLVHSANALARRHDRVRLKTSSPSPSSLCPPSDLSSALPAWHHGFRRKARTPRPAKCSTAAPKPVLLVPELQVEEDEDEEELLLYRVPVFDPVLAEFRSPPALDETSPTSTEEAKPPAMSQLLLPAENHSAGFPGFDPSDAELAEFAADVESLLGQGLGDEPFCIDGLGLLDTREIDDGCQVKMELMISDAIDTNATFLADMETAFSRESIEFDFDCESPTTEEEAEVQKAETVGEEIHCGTTTTMKVGLRLDYEAVITAWSSCQGCSPWTNGERPQFNLDDSWPNFTGTTWGSAGGGDLQGGYGEIGMGRHGGNGDGGREARVSRYREKRRTRLFSKKIRYEVRKLNAEKRPRMKGRFVKRSSFPAPPPAAAAAAGFTYV